jgi:elongator complex protein 2
MTHLIVTGSSDGTIQSWKLSSANNEPKLIQSFTINGKIPLDLALTYLPGSSSLILAVGCTENRIPLYSGSINDCILSKSLSLEGHSDWVRCLAFQTPLPLDSPSSNSASTLEYDISAGEILLASGSQDNYIRLWRFSRIAIETSIKKDPLDELDELERTLAEVGGEEGELRVKAHDFSVARDGVFSCSAEAVLLGHDSWVTGLHWSPISSPTSATTTTITTLRLLSSSADRSLILWTPSATTSTDSIWTNAHRFGEFASATNLGFFGALWGKDSKTVFAHGWGGAFHVWRTKEGVEWDPIVAVAGHFEMVKSLAWEPEGEFLLSAG